MKGLDEATANEYARWFRCLSDGTRVLILSIVAATDEPMTVGDIVAVVDRSQSTVSRHLQLLARDEFVLMDPSGVRTLVRVNDACMEALPSAAAAIMGDRRPESATP